MAEMIAKWIKQLCKLRDLILFGGGDRTTNVKRVPYERDVLAFTPDAKFSDLSLEPPDVLCENGRSGGPSCLKYWLMEACIHHPHSRNHEYCKLGK